MKIDIDVNLIWQNIYKIADGIVKALKIDESTKRLFIQRNLDIVREKVDFDKEMRKMEGLYWQLTQTY